MRKKENKLRLQYVPSTLLEELQTIAPLGTEIELHDADYVACGTLLAITEKLKMDAPYVRVILHRMKKAGFVDSPRKGVWVVKIPTTDPRVKIRMRQAMKHPKKEKPRKLIMAAGCKYPEWNYM